MRQDNSRQPKREARETKQAVEMPDRVPLSGYRDKLHVFGKDPDYYYKWIQDADANGGNILWHKRAGFSLVDKDEVTVGAESIFKTEDVGDVVSAVGRDGVRLFLMKQPMKYRLEDIELYHKDNDMTESAILNPQVDPEDFRRVGQYGAIEVDR